MKIKFIRKKKILSLGIFFFFTVFFLLLFSSCTSEGKCFTYQRLRQQDAKFFDEEKIITSIDGKLQFFDLTSEELIQTEIPSNWIASLKNSPYVLASSSVPETLLATVNSSYGIDQVDPVFGEENGLLIDPQLIKSNERYYLTITKIDGTVNRSDPSQENGFYSVLLYASDDCANWEFVSEPIKRSNNIEDVDLSENDGNLILVYEEETLDKGASSIQVITSHDGGLHFSEPVILIDDGADNEPASLLQTNDGYELYFSSDVHQPGESYSGGEIFIAKLDKNFHVDSISEIASQKAPGVLLYDVRRRGEQTEYLYAYDYLGENSLCYECIP